MLPTKSTTCSSRTVYALRSCRVWQTVKRPFKVATNGFADDAPFGLEPTRPGGEAVVLQPDERPQRTTDVVPLAPCGPDVAPLHTRELLEPPVVLLDRPRQLPEHQPGRLAHPEGRHVPYSRGAVWVDHPN